MNLIRWLVIAAMLVPWPARGQGTLLQAGPATAGHPPVYAAPSTGQAVVQDPGPAGGGGVGVSELPIIARGTPGTGPNGEQFCIYDAPINNPAGYHYLCLSANVNGNGVITYGAAGGATPGVLNFIINGVVTPAP
jgi:hypothetical protein